jgi:hypothetical protein
MLALVYRDATDGDARPWFTVLLDHTDWSHVVTRQLKDARLSYESRTRQDVDDVKAF